MANGKGIKIYVSVDVAFNEDSVILPRQIIWEDGHKYDIDRVKYIKQSAVMHCGGLGDRYTVYIGGQEHYLYFERNCSLTGNNIGKCFVERAVSA